jgi:hypothetical protein
MDFFFYGTLIDPEVRELVLGRPEEAYALSKATLPGHRRVFVSGRTYPIVIPRFYDSVDGLLVRGLDAEAGNRLVAFEGPEYRMAMLEVKRDDGVAALARIFVANATAKPTLQPWDYEGWRRTFRDDYIRRLRAGG